MQDESLLETTITTDDPTQDTVQYYIVDSGSERGKRKLADSTGFSYTVKVCTKLSSSIYLYLNSL